MKKIIFCLMTASLFMIACNNEKKEEGSDKKETAMAGGENKQERNKKTVWASMEAVGKGDIDGMVKDAAPMFTDYNDGSMPPVTNLDSLKGFIKMLTTSIEGYKPTNQMLFADGDYVLAYATWTGTFKSDLMGIKATGKAVSFPDVDIFKLNEEGKIVEHRSVQNTGAVLMASGMMK
jgi:predicted ester cyclase